MICSCRVLESCMKTFIKVPGQYSSCPTRGSCRQSSPPTLFANQRLELECCFSARCSQQALPATLVLAVYWKCDFKGEPGVVEDVDVGMGSSLREALPPFFPFFFFPADQASALAFSQFHSKWPLTSPCVANNPFSSSDMSMSMENRDAKRVARRRNITLRVWVWLLWQTLLRNKSWLCRSTPRIDRPTAF